MPILDLVNDLKNVSLSAGKNKRDKITSLLSSIEKSEYKDFVVSNIHAKMLTLGDITLLRKIERGGYETDNI